MNFNDYNISDNIKEAIKKAGYSTPTPIQAGVLEHALQGHDILGQAQTGTGKTASFVIPILQNTDVELKKIQHIILVPTRELATQVCGEVEKLGASSGIRHVQIMGGVSYDRQREKLKDKPHILVATPGRFKDYLENKGIDISEVKTLTLDEVDQLLSIGFLKDIEYIISKLPKQRQNFFFSATLGKKVSELADQILNDPKVVSISSGLSSSSTIRQEYIIAKDHDKFNLLKVFLQIHKPQGAIIFCKTKKQVDDLAYSLKKDGFPAEGIQGDLNQNLRSRIMQRFRNGDFKIIVGTDVLARGIDVDFADVVYNYDLPMEIENYTHRIGRVGRAGKEGLSLSFVKSSQRGYFKDIMRETNSNAVQAVLPTPEALDKIYKDEAINKLMTYVDYEGALPDLEWIESSYTQHQLAKIAAVLVKKSVNRIKIDGELLKTENLDKPRSSHGGERSDRNRSGDRNRGGDRRRSGDRGGDRRRSGERSGERSRDRKAVFPTSSSEGRESSPRRDFKPRESHDRKEQKTDRRSSFIKPKRSQSDK